MSVILCVLVCNVHNQHGQCGGQMSAVFSMSWNMVMYKVDHGHGIPTTFTGLGSKLPGDKHCDLNAPALSTSPSSLLHKISL